MEIGLEISDFNVEVGQSVGIDILPGLTLYRETNPSLSPF